MNFNFFPYLYDIFNFIVETSSWAHFKDNFALIKKLKTCVTLKWVLPLTSLHSKHKKFRNVKISVNAHKSELKMGKICKTSKDI